MPAVLRQACGMHKLISIRVQLWLQVKKSLRFRRHNGRLCTHKQPDTVVTKQVV